VVVVLVETLVHHHQEVLEAMALLVAVAVDTQTLVQVKQVGLA
jgi:hypothetical protein